MFKISTILLIIVTFIFTFFNEVNAGLVPGTINKSSYISAITCNVENPSYSPSGGSCYSSSSCKVIGLNNCPAGNATPDTCDNSTPGTAPDYLDATPDTCDNSTPDTMDAYCGCDTYYQYPNTSGTLNFNSYSKNEANPTYSLADNIGNNKKLTDDINVSCNKWANGTSNIAPTFSGLLQCVDGNANYYVGGSSGVCNLFGSTDNLISSYNQLGVITRVLPSNTDGRCSVEGRYATPDYTAPTATVLQSSDVFTTDNAQWCNLEKYLANDYGTEANPVLAACESYKEKLNHADATDANPDLLEGLEINIQDDLSGISSVTVELGAKCSGTWTFDTDVADIVKNANSPLGIKDALKNITIKYDTEITNTSATGDKIDSLLTKFGKTRLDQCLGEGENYITVTAKDNARSNADGKIYAPNEGKILNYSTSSKYIRIDSKVANLQVSGDKSTSPGCNTLVNGDGNGGDWRNFSIIGNLFVSDATVADECNPGIDPDTPVIDLTGPLYQWEEGFYDQCTDGFKSTLLQCTASNGQSVDSSNCEVSKLPSGYKTIGSNYYNIKSCAVNYCTAGGVIECVVAP